MKRKNFTPKQSVTISLVTMLLLFFISVPQQIDAQDCHHPAGNDLVQVALDHNCEARITVDMITEGELSAQCTYLIQGMWEEDGTEILPVGGIPGNYVVDGSYIGQTITAWVGLDHPTDRWNVEGFFYLVDKLPPTLNCLEDVFVSCNEDLSDYLDTNSDITYLYTPGDALSLNGTPVSGFPRNIGAGEFLLATVTVDNAANQSEFLDRLSAVLDVSSAGGTTGVQVQIWPPDLVGYIPVAQNDPFVNPDFDGTQMKEEFLHGFTDPGEWTVQVLNNSGSTVTLEDLGLRFESSSFLTSQYGLEDNCAADEIVVLSDETIDLKDCGLWSATRTITFQGRDEAGMLSDICTHTIYFERKTVLDIVWPLNRDDYQLDAFNCTDLPEWDTNNDGYPQPEESGLPTVDGIPLIPNDGYSGYCEIGLTYTDQRIDICPGTFKILRLWTAVNCCGPTGQDNPITHYQIIKIVDDEGPIGSFCAGNCEEVSANPFTCLTDVVLPDPRLECIFDCSLGQLTYTVEYKFVEGTFDCPEPDFDAPEFPWETANLVLNGDGTYTLLDVPYGLAWIRFKIIDPCENYTYLNYFVIVKDDIPPVPVCDEHTVVTVTGDCSARAFAETFDDGSFDNCSDVRFEVRRMTGTCGGTHVFGPYVEFCSYDVGQTVMIELKVIDAFDNFNTCMVEARVDDKTPPYVICPPDIEIPCEWDYTDLEVTGAAEAFDNCGIKDLDYEDSGDLTNCNVGTIYRTWTVTDFNDRTHQCTQTITIYDNNPFSRKDIDWPADVLNLEGCINADTDPSNTGEPIVEDDFCSLVAVTYEDQVFTLVEDACYKILRNWIVVDWCQFDPSDRCGDPGKWCYTQVIMVYNYDAPEFTSSCDDIEICGYNADCTGDVDITATAEDECTPTDQLVWEWRVDLFDDETIEYFGFTNNFSRTHVPMGTHRIYWTVEELCGNISTCNYLFTVTDCKKPTPLCISEITTVLMPSSGMVEVKARDFDHGSYDNCTDGATCDDCHSDLFYSFSSDETDATRVFTIADVGLNDVQMWVTDAYGNQDYCDVSIMIQDNANLSGMVAGFVSTEDNEKVENVQMELEEINAHESIFGNTNNEGFYQMQGNYDNGDYKVTANKEDLYSRGVSTLDLVIIQKHLLGLAPLTSPYKLLAADADNNNAVSANDLFQLRKLILGVDNVLHSSEAWNFVNDDYMFAKPDNPWHQGDDELMYSVILRNLDRDEMHNDFVAIKIGDVNGSISQLISQQEIQSRSVVNLFTQSQSFRKDEIVEVPVFSGDFKGIAGLQLTLGYDIETFEYVAMKGAAMKLDAQNIAIRENGKLNLSWNEAGGIIADENEVLFTIELRAKTNGQLINQITMNSDLLEAEVYTNALDISNVGFNIRTNESKGFVLYQNTPNPFAQETEIVFDLPSSTMATLTVYDVTGKVLKAVSQEFAKGRNSVSMSKNDLKTTGGVLYYQLETENDLAIRKMIMLK